MQVIKSLFFRVVVVCTLLLVPLLVLLIYHSGYAMKVVREQVTKYNSSFLGAAASESDKILEETRLYLSKLINSDFDINTLHFHPTQTVEYESNKQRIIHKINSDLSFYSIIDTFFVYSIPNDDLMIATKGIYQERYEHVQEIIKSQKRVGEVSDGYYWELIKLGGTYHLLKSIGSDSGVSMGALIRAETMLALIDVTDKGEALLTTADGRSLVAQVQAAMVYKEAYLELREASKWSEIQFVLRIPEKDILKSLPFFRLIITIVPILVLLLLIVGFYALQNMVYKPLMELTRGMRRLANGEFTYRLPEHPVNEVRFLHQSFNNMAEQIQKLKIDIYEEQLNVQRAELKHLQVQINPHFYVNSLNMISSLSIIQKNDLVQQMVQYLSDYFRYVTRSNRTLIPLKEEIVHIQNYLEIHKLMFQHRLSYRLAITEDAENALVAPLTLQPFVENAIVHGLMKSKNALQLLVEASIQTGEVTDLLVISIIDDGNGFSLEKLNELREGCFKSKHSDKHIGIWNVFQRLRLHFGDQAEILFNNSEDQGARVTLIIPVQLGIGEVHHV